MIKVFKQNKIKLFFNKFLFCLLFIDLTFSANATVLKVLTENLPPFQLFDNNKKITGFATDVIKAVLNKTPYQYEIDLHPWSQSYAMAQKNNNTCIYSIAREKSRESLFQWVGQIATTNTYFISLKTNKKVKINSIDDAKNYITAVIKDDFTHQTLKRNGFIENKNFYVINNSDSLLKLLVSRKNIDFVLIDSLTMNFRIKSNNLDPNLFITHVQLNQQPIRFYFACSNSTPTTIVNKLKQAFISVEQSGEKQKILNLWLQKNVGVLRE